jgi:hypothetical protein
MWSGQFNKPKTAIIFNKNISSVRAARFCASAAQVLHEQQHQIQIVIHFSGYGCSGYNVRALEIL